MKRALWRLLAIVLTLSVFDALIGGGIAAVLQQRGWIQAANDVYQLGFGLIVLSTLLIMDLVLKWRREALATFMLFIGLVEDTLFYLLIPVLNPVISFITGGATYRPRGGRLFPIEISSWHGWVSRIVGLENVSVPIMAVFVINLLAVIIAYILLKKLK